MTVRPARIEDARALGEIHVGSWQQAYRGLIPDDFLDGLDVERRVAWFADRIGGGDLVLATEDAGGLVGFCSAGPARAEPGWGEIYAIYLLPSAWGTGLGSQLLAEAERRLSAEGFTQALLWVLVDNRRARAFYERHGWSSTDRTEDLEIGGVTVAEVRYDKDLITR